MTDLEHARQIHERFWNGIVSVLSLPETYSGKILNINDLYDFVVSKNDFSDVTQLEKYDWFFWKSERSILCMYKENCANCPLACSSDAGLYRAFISCTNTKRWDEAIKLAGEIRDCWR